MEDDRVVKIRSSKTDQLKKEKILLERCLGPICPVKLLLKWIEFAKLDKKDFLFLNINTGRK